MHCNIPMILLATFFFIIPSTALAKPNVVIDVNAEKEIRLVENGKTTTKKVPAKEIRPGEVLSFQISYVNNGEDPATKVLIENPIPEAAEYLPGTATEAGEVTFSIDGGETFKKPALLTYEITNSDGSVEQKTASPEQYTHIRWQIPLIDAGASGILNFQVQIK